jgi:hypothetical protein
MITNKKPKRKAVRTSFLPPTWGVLSAVARELGVSRSAVSDVARGKKKSARISAALAEAMKPKAKAAVHGA